MKYKYYLMIDMHREDMDAVVEKAEEMFQMLDAGGDGEVSQVTNILLHFVSFIVKCLKLTQDLLSP